MQNLFFPIFCPKLGEEQIKKRSSLKFSSNFCPKLGEEQKKKGLHSSFVQFFAERMVGSKNLTRKPDLFRAPLSPGPGTMYPLNPPLAGPVTDIEFLVK